MYRKKKAVDENMQANPTHSAAVAVPVRLEFGIFLRLNSRGYGISDERMLKDVRMINERGEGD
jgi:hypothetical protein